MSNVVCRHCHTPNPYGSKFCNHCGNALPPATELICPHCQTPNPHDLLYCDNCGTKLLQDARAAEEEPASEGPAAPGDTGDLEVNSLREWMKSDTRDEIVEPAPAEAQETSVLADWLSELSELDRAGASDAGPPDRPGQPSADAADIMPDGEELPDWMLELQAAARGEPPADELPDWLDEIAGADSPDEGRPTAAVELPDWMQEIDSDVTAGGEAAESPSDAAIGELPDWLVELGELSPAEPPVGEALPDRMQDTDSEWADDTLPEELPDWLSASGARSELATGALDWLKASDVADEELPDWIGRAHTGETGQLAGEPVARGAAPDVPPEQDWGHDEAVPDIVPDWLTSAAGEQMPEMGDALPDWMHELAGEGDPSLAAGEPLPDWLQDDGPAAAAEPPADDPPDWLNDMSDEAGPDKAAADPLPGWMQPPPATADEEAGLTEAPPRPSEASDDTATSSPAWLDELGELSTPERSPGQAQPDWMMEIDAAAADDVLADEAPDWLRASGTESDTNGWDESAAAGDDSLDGLPDWMLEAHTGQTGELPAGVSAHEAAPTGAGELDLSDEDAAADSLPDWLTQPAGAEWPVPLDTLPDWLQEAESPTAPLKPIPPGAKDDMPWIAAGNTEPLSPDSEGLASLMDAAGAPADEELPDWLRDAAPGESGAVVEGANALPTADLPDWLRDVQTVGKAAEAIFNEEPQLEERVEGDAPDWLSADTGLDEATASAIFTMAGQEDSGPEHLPAWPTDESAGEQPAVSPASPGEDLPDWIKEMAPREADLLAPGESQPPTLRDQPGDEPLLPDISPSDALPDWLVELAPPGTGPLGRSGTGPLKPPTPADLGMDLDESAAENVDWLSALLAAEGDEEVEGPASPGDDQGEKPVLWPLTAPPPSEELTGVPEQLASPGLPEWMVEEFAAIPDEPAPVAAEPAYDTLPDWLDSPGSAGLDHAVDQALQSGDEPAEAAGAEWRDILGDMTLAGEPLPPPPSVELTADDDIPAWLQALRPRSLMPEAPIEEADEPLVTIGPLAGIPGVIPIATDMIQPREASRRPGFTVTKEQQQQVALLRQLALDEPRQPVAVDRRSSATPAPLARLLLAALLLAALFVGQLLPMFGVNLFAAAPPPLNAAAVDAHDAIAAAAGQPVLVVFDFTPALAGELESAAHLFLEELSTNQSETIAVSQYATGLAMSEPFPAVTGRYFVPGGAIGLRHLAACLQDSGDCRTVAGAPLLADGRDSLADVALVLVLTGERDSLVDWMEQIAAQSDTPVVAAVTQALAPVAQPYLLTGQLDGLVDGLPGAAAYEARYHSSDMFIAGQYADQGLARWLVLVLFVLGNVAGGLLALRRPGKDAA